MMSKNVDTSFGGGCKGQKPRISGEVWGSSYFSASQHPQTSANVLKRCIWMPYNIPPNSKPKY